MILAFLNLRGLAPYKSASLPPPKVDKPVARPQGTDHRHGTQGNPRSRPTEAVHNMDNMSNKRMMDRQKFNCQRFIIPLWGPRWATHQLDQDRVCRWLSARPRLRSQGVSRTSGGPARLDIRSAWKGRGGCRRGRRGHRLFARPSRAAKPCALLECLVARLKARLRGIWSMQSRASRRDRCLNAGSLHGLRAAPDDDASSKAESQGSAQLKPGTGFRL